MKKLMQSRKIKILSLMVLVVGIIAANLSIFAAAVLEIEATPNYSDSKINLDWNVEGGDVDGYSYKVYRKESNGTYQPISSVDFTNELEVVNVLNVYPEASGIPRVTFTYTDGTTQTLPKSASMKVWMEGGSMTQDGVTTTFAALGINPLNARQLIKVTPVSSSAFNNTPSMVWNYDVVMFGTWDTNGNYDDQPNDAAVEELKKFLNAGFGVVAGHDTIGYNYEHGLNKIREYFAIETGCWSGPGTKTSNYDIDNVWGYASTTATVVTNDVLTSYPWNLPVGTKLTIPNTHTCANAAKGIVAMQLTDGAQYSDFAAIANYTGTGNPYYYVTRNNNAVMVQTGHSNCQSTEDERKVLANAVFYLKQMTELNYSMDNNVADSEAPDAVSASNVIRNKTSVSMTLSRVDNGTIYEYYVEGVDKTNGTKLTSNTTSAEYTSEVKGYSYVVDNNATTDVDTTIDTTSSSLTATIGNGPNTYLHVRAIDNAGNVGPVTHILLHSNIAPDMTLFPDITTWTNTDVVITANATDDDGTITSILKPDNSTASAATTTYTVSQNGTYSFTATDNSGATVTKEMEITWIDKVDPEGQTTGITQPTETNRYATINFKATDDASGVAKIILPDGSEVTTDTTTYNVTTPGTYTFKVIDVAGNEREVPIPVTIVSDGLEVKFIDQVTKEEITPKQTRTGNIGDEYTTS
ncbi:MAG: hypothetical protein J6A15_05165, partial [Clostridia bacterium]|nr:hypothetical protein [Clostridia bacterium]